MRRCSYRATRRLRPPPAAAPLEPSRRRSSSRSGTAAVADGRRRATPGDGVGRLVLDSPSSSGTQSSGWMDSRRRLGPLGPRRPAGSAAALSRASATAARHAAEARSGPLSSMRPAPLRATLPHSARPGLGPVSTGRPAPPVAPRRRPRDGRPAPSRPLGPDRRAIGRAATARAPGTARVERRVGRSPDEPRRDDPERRHAGSYRCPVPDLLHPACRTLVPPAWRAPPDLIPTRRLRRCAGVAPRRHGPDRVRHHGRCRRAPAIAVPGRPVLVALVRRSPGPDDELADRLTRGRP